MKPKKLIEVSLPIKEISAESVRDNRLTFGHIKTLHMWWARRPLPVCRAVVFASLVPDPLDPDCPQAFRDAVKYLLHTKDSFAEIQYRPYDDIPYTSIKDKMEDNLRNRLMMFIGKFSDKCQKNMIAGNSTSPKEQLSDGSLIKWENKNNPKILRIARELIWVAYNAELHPQQGFETLHENFNEALDAIEIAEKELYSRPDRHIPSAEIEVLEGALQFAIENFQANMPSVFDPFAGGGAIPLEAARLGCRSYGNDINPVAHIIERASAEFPQRFGKPITYSRSEFEKTYGQEGIQLAMEKGIPVGDLIEIPNRLVFDVEFLAKQLISDSFNDVGHLYPSFALGKKTVAFYHARTAKCSNPSCCAEVPLLRQFYLVNSSKKKLYLSPIINCNRISFEIQEGTIPVSLQKGWQQRGNLICPCCNAITPVSEVKKQSRESGLSTRLLAVIEDAPTGKSYRIIDESLVPTPYLSETTIIPHEKMAKNSNGGDTLLWGIDEWGKLFTNRQLVTITAFINNLNKVHSCNSDEYSKAIKVFLSIFIDRIILYNTSFGIYETGNEKVNRIFGRQAISMVLDFPESNPFCGMGGSALNQLEWILRYIESESSTSFQSTFFNCSSGDITQFKEKSVYAVITDPPYYNAIAYADISDFFYVWLKHMLVNEYPEIFSTPQTPKSEECTALKHYHGNDENRAKEHFEKKLTHIFKAIRYLTSEIVSIMFAHQSTEAWTTLCNSILSSSMNISSSWAMDTELATGMKADKATLESSVTVSCRPSLQKGYGEFKEVKHDIVNKVTQEVEDLYTLGFRGADLLTACFGQAVSEFGKYETVEKADGSTVTVAELLEIARSSAFDALLKGIKADDYTRFYIGWLQMNGMGDCDSDDATKFTRVGVNVEINEIKYQRLLIADGNHVRLATAEEHLGTSRFIKDIAQQPIINQVHRAILLYRDGEKAALLSLIKECAPQSSDQFWRVLATLKELLPTGPDLKDVTGLLLTQETLRVDCQKDFTPQMPSLFDEI